MRKEEKQLTELNHLAQKRRLDILPAKVQSWERHRWDFLDFFDDMQV